MRKILFAIFILYGFNIQAQILHHMNKDLPCLNKEFNFHVHVALDSLGNTNFSMADLQGAIDEANKFFSPICVSFKICGWDSMPNYNFDSLATQLEQREVRSHYHAKRRINIYVADELHEPTICGFANVGGVANLNLAYVFLKKGCPGALTHELGHLFGLLHTFEGNGVENVNGSNCHTHGDLICDTPADPFVPEDRTTIWTRKCEFVFDGVDANGQFYQPQVGNIMSYYDCPSCGFTREQYLKMVETYERTFEKLW